MNWYLKVLKQYADFNGRARRTEYWMFGLFSAIISWGLQLVGYLIGSAESITILSSLYSLAVLIPGIAVGTRRLHDINKSGWFQLLWFLPIIGWIWIIVLLAKNGDEGENEYGSDPKNPNNELDEIGSVEI